METTFNLFDLFFIFGLIAIVVIAFFRGFTREFFSLLNLVLSIVLTIFLSDLISYFLKSFISDKFLSSSISLIISFIVIFITSSIITRKLANIVREKIPFSTDQFLGVAFGFVKSLIIFGFIFAFAVNLNILFSKTEPKSYVDAMPRWIYQAQFRSVLAPFAKSFDPIVKMLLERVDGDFADKVDEVVDHKKINKQSKSFFDFGSSEVKKVKKKVERLEPYGIYQKKSKKVAEKIEKTGYNKDQIEKMDNLINNIE